MQSHGITLSFHCEMADSARESYPRFIKGGFQDYEGLGIKRSTADSKHVPSPRSRLLGTPPFEPSPESSRIFGINWNFGRLFQIEAMAQMAIAEPNRSHSPHCLCKAPRQKTGNDERKGHGLN
jgi:hypothetical protein